MEDLLKPVKTIHISSQDPKSEPLIRDLSSSEQPKKTYASLSSPDDILKALKSQLSHEEVLDVIRYLKSSTISKTGFNIKRPGPKAAQILNVLVSRTIPDHWTSLDHQSGSASDLKRSRGHPPNAATGLIQCLNSVTGIGAFLAQIKTLLRGGGESAAGEQSSQKSAMIKDLLSVLQRIFDTPDFIFYIHSDTASLIENQALRQVIWKEFISIVAGGRALSTATEAFLACKDALVNTEQFTLADGKAYALWLGQQVSQMILKIDATDANVWKETSLLFQRSLGLGYSEQIIDEVFSGLLYSSVEQWDLVKAFFDNLPAHHQRVMLETLIKISAKRYLTSGDPIPIGEPSLEVSGVAYLLKCLVLGNDLLEGFLVDWLTGATGGGAGQGVGIRRAAVAALSSNFDKLQQILEKSLQSFGDKLYIKHSPILQQEVNTQILLLTAGSVHRTIPSFLSRVSKSGIFLNAISNRLSASSTRSRFLGMIIGVAISRLVDPQEKRMKFDLDELSSGDSQWYLGLTEIEDRIGSIQDLQIQSCVSRTSKAETHSRTKAKVLSHQNLSTPPIKPARATSKIISIEEISDGSKSEDDIMSYEKPDSDAEDSEDDPTLLQRNKPIAPVYIRDLIAGLRDSENYERHKLALTTAPSLIRRKIGFGTEVAENIEDLALVLVGLQDKYEFEKFQENQLQSMVTVLIAKPEQMGPWYVRTLFNGDLSTAQRTSIITTLGLGARELAGHREEDSKVMGLPELPESSFPSKTLPERLHAIYSSDGVSKLTKQLSDRTIEPLASNAADQMTGPNALKIRTFSSRMEVEKKRKQRETQKSRARNKDLNKILTEHFILPLTGRFAVALHSWTDAYNPYLNPFLLIALLQTFTLLLHTLGSSSTSTSDITHELLPLLFSLRSLPTASEPTILEALLSVFLAIVDFNTATSTSEERLVTDYAREVTELREWAGGVFERTPQSEEKVRMLAAGIMVKIGEVAERWERRLLGAGVGF